jgi:multiple sugar transport system permease protein
MANITTWSYTGYNMLIIYSSLKSISGDLYEAARIDGASELTIARRIKVPAVRNALVLTGVLSIIGTLQLFTEPTILSGITPTVDGQFTPTMFAFNAAFQDGNTGLASAASLILAVLAGVLSIGFFRITTRRAAR